MYTIYYFPVSHTLELLAAGRADGVHDSDTTPTCRPMHARVGHADHTDVTHHEVKAVLLRLVCVDAFWDERHMRHNLAVLLVAPMCKHETLSRDVCFPGKGIRAKCVVPVLNHHCVVELHLELWEPACPVSFEIEPRVTVGVWPHTGIEEATGTVWVDTILKPKTEPVLALLVVQDALYLWNVHIWMLKNGLERHDAMALHFGHLRICELEPNLTFSRLCNPSLRLETSLRQDGGHGSRNPLRSV